MIKIAFEGKKNKSTKSINKRSLRKEGVFSILIVAMTMPQKKNRAISRREIEEIASRDNSSKNHENEKILNLHNPVQIRARKNQFMTRQNEFV